MTAGTGTGSAVPQRPPPIQPQELTALVTSLSSVFQAREMIASVNVMAYEYPDHVRVNVSSRSRSVTFVVSRDRLRDPDRVAAQVIDGLVRE